MEEAEIMMTPVCSCGYVFNHLSYKCIYENDNVMFGVGRFEPYECPKCKKRITNIKTKIQPHNNEYIFDNDL